MKQVIKYDSFKGRYHNLINHYLMLRWTQLSHDLLLKKPLKTVPRLNKFGVDR